MVHPVRDPEMSAAAKRRKPPPNPWPELRALRNTHDTLLELHAHAKREADFYAQIAGLRASLNLELRKRLFRNQGRIQALERQIEDLAKAHNKAA
jgi:hypothetical protein